MTTFLTRVAAGDTLRRDAQPPPLVNRPRHLYLDQNKWIDLARAWHDRPGGERFRATLDTLLRLVQQDKIVLPLSSTHVLETARAGDPDRRKRLVEVMVALGRGSVIAPSHAVIRVLARRSAQELFVRTPPEAAPAIFGRGIAFAFGESLQSALAHGRTAEQAALLEAALDTPGGWMHMLSVDDEKLRQAGVSASRRVSADAAKRRQGGRFRYPMSKAERIRAVYANAMIDLREEVDGALAAIGRTPNQMMALGHSSAMAWAEAIPPLRIEACLAVERDLHRDRVVVANDVQDIASLSMAIAYCDVTVTERFWTDIATRLELCNSYGTRIVSDLASLPDLLEVAG